MTPFKAVAAGALAIALAAMPVAPAFAGGGSHHYGKRHYYGNPFYPVVGLAAAVVGAAAAVVTLPFAIIGAAASHAPAYYGPGPAQQNYYPQQGNVGYGAPGYGAPGYGAPAYAAPRAYYPAPAESYYHVPPAYSSGPRAQYDAPRPGRHGDYDGYRGDRGYPSSAGYYAQDGGPGAGNYAPRPRPYGRAYADYSYAPPNQR